MADTDTTADTITLRLIEHGETTIEVDRDEYEEAKTDGNLDHYLDAWASDVDTDTVVIEPDGTLIDPYSDAAPRTSLLGRDVTAGVAAIIEQAPAGRDCRDCAPGQLACARHIAEHLVEAVRQERLIRVRLDRRHTAVLPVDDQDDTP